MAADQSLGELRQLEIALDGGAACRYGHPADSRARMRCNPLHGKAKPGDPADGEREDHTGGL